jgi:hypothetical protein
VPIAEPEPEPEDAEVIEDDAVGMSLGEFEASLKRKRKP